MRYELQKIKINMPWPPVFVQVLQATMATSFETHIDAELFAFQDDACYHSLRGRMSSIEALMNCQASSPSPDRHRHALKIGLVIDQGAVVAH